MYNQVDDSLFHVLKIKLGAYKCVYPVHSCKNKKWVEQCLFYSQIPADVAVDIKVKDFKCVIQWEGEGRKDRAKDSRKETSVGKSVKMKIYLMLFVLWFKIGMFAY